MPESQVPSAVVLDLTGYRLEKHVHEALQVAWRLSAGFPMNASHLLRSARILSVSARSSAFSKIASFPFVWEDSSPSIADLPPLDLAALPVVKPLAASFFVAEEFLSNKKVVWGRDFVTVALLARGDLSVTDTVVESGSSIQSLRNEWLEFVRSSGKRRSREAWEKWWRRAGFPLPGKTGSSSTSPTPASSTTYLLTWNPTKFPFPKLEEHAEEIRNQGFTH